MLKINEAAQEILKRFQAQQPLDEKAQKNKVIIESAYGRLIAIFLYANQDALGRLPRENLEDVNSALIRIYESHYWVGKSLENPTDSGYDSVEWLLISDKHDGIVTEAFRIVSDRIIRCCPSNLFLEEALIKLLSAHEIACNVTHISQGITDSALGRNRDLRKRRSEKGFVLEASKSGGIKDEQPMSAAKLRRIVAADKATWLPKA